MCLQLFFYSHPLIMLSDKLIILIARVQNLGGREAVCGGVKPADGLGSSPSSPVSWLGDLGHLS